MHSFKKKKNRKIIHEVGLHYERKMIFFVYILYIYYTLHFYVFFFLVEGGDEIRVLL